MAVRRAHDALNVVVHAFELLDSCGTLPYNASGSLNPQCVAPLARLEEVA
jgi:hypothetical protein